MNNENAIDWTLILINTQISLYLCKHDVFNLTLTSKLIRCKLIPIYYNTIKISDKVLLNHPNYFMNEKILEFGTNDSLWDLWFIAKNWLNDDLAFKEAHIDPFVKEVNRILKQRAIHCKSLSFECLGKACYFLLPVALEFLNLRTLTLSLCVIPLKQLSNLLVKLTKLEALDLNNSDVIKSFDSNSINGTIFPQSLRSLTYINIRTWSITLPLEAPLQFLKSSNSTTNLPDHSLLPQFLPKLKYLSYFSIIINQGLLKFLEINCHIKDLSLPINLLSSIKNNNELIKNIKILKLYALCLQTEEYRVDKSTVPNFPNLKVLTLHLRTSEQLEFSELLIKKCPKISRLYVFSPKLEFYKLRELVKFAKSLKYFNDKKLF